MRQKVGFTVFHKGYIRVPESFVTISTSYIRIPIDGWEQLGKPSIVIVMYDKINSKIALCPSSGESPSVDYKVRIKMAGDRIESLLVNCKAFLHSIGVTTTNRYRFEIDKDGDMLITLS